MLRDNQIPIASSESGRDLSSGTTSPLLAAWFQNLAAAPESIAVSSDSGDVTFGELDTRSTVLAGRIAGFRSNEETVAAVFINDRCHLPTALLACAKAGLIYLPIDSALPVLRIRAILSEATPAVLLTDQPSDTREFANFPVVNILDSTIASQSAHHLHVPSPDEILALLFTSGSTGRPKGVTLTHANIANEVIGIAQATRIQSGDRAIQFASPGFDASIEEILAPLISGATLVPRPSEISASFVDFDAFLRKAHITIVNLPTAFWIAWVSWMQSEKIRLPENVRCTIIGGEQATAKAVADWMQCGGDTVQLLNAYGPTEASIAATVHTVKHSENNPPIGRPLPGYNVQIVDQNDDKIEAANVAGELWIGGAGLSPGYWKRPDLTATAFHQLHNQRWYRTGDQARWNERGELEYLGRIDDQIKIRGNRIEPAEVIHAIQSFQGIAAAHAGTIATTTGQVLAAWVKWRSPAPADWPTQLARHIASQLPAAAVPVLWAEVDQFFLTERGKLDRHRLPTPLLTSAKSSSYGVSEPPSTESEKLMVKIWIELLGCGPVARSDSFFELGGNSLLALQLFARISAEFGKILSMGLLLQKPTLESLSAAVDDTCNSDAIPGTKDVIPVKESGTLAPLFCIHGGDGGVLFYKNLSNHLDDQRPLLAIESPILGIQGKLPEVSIENTATDYIESIRSHQPRGPYYLCGYSFGGLVAYEIARLLVDQGEEISFLGIYDSQNPQAQTRPYTAAERVQVYWRHCTQGNLLARSLQAVSRVRSAVQLRREIEYTRSLQDTDPYSNDRALQVRERNAAAYDAYIPSLLPVLMTLFKTTETDDKFAVPYDYGWQPLVKSLQIIELPGEHLTMFDDRNVSDLALATNQALARAEKGEAALIS